MPLGTESRGPGPMDAPSTTRIRNLVSVEDLSTAEILELFRFAKDYARDLRAWSDVCRTRPMCELTRSRCVRRSSFMLW